MNFNQDDKSIKLPSLPDMLYNEKNMEDSYATDSVIPFYATYKPNESIEVLNSSPYFIRSTYYTIPNTQEYININHMPLGVHITPFCDRSEVSEIDIPERCSMCRSYPSKLTIRKDNYYLCNICNNRLRLTKENSLAFPSFEFKLTDPNLKHQPICTFIFDISTKGLVSLALDSLCQFITDNTFTNFHPKLCFVCIGNNTVTFAKNLQGELSILDIQSEIVPKISKSSIFDSNDTETILEIVEIIRGFNSNVENKIDSVFDVIENLNQLVEGNKVILFTSQTSTYNYEKFLEKNRNFCFNLIFLRDGTSVIRMNTELSSLDSLKRMSFYSGGVFRELRPENINDLSIFLLNICRQMNVFNIKMYLKASDNIIKEDVIAPGLDLTLSTLKLNSLHSNSIVSYTLGLNEYSINNKFLQVETRYINYDGVKKCRIFNLGIQSGMNYYRTVSVDSIFAFLVKKMVEEDINLDEELTKIIGYYMRKIKSTSNLTLPDTLKILPVLVQSVSKHISIDSTDIILGNVEQIIKLFYPRLICLSDYQLNKELIGLRLTTKSIIPGEIYILENSKEITFYVPDGISEELFLDIFNLELEKADDSFIRNDTEGGLLCYSIISKIESHYNYFLPLRIIRAGDPEEAKFLSYLIEDSLNGKEDYYSSLCTLYDKIKN
ncbi:SC24C [Hepatospora eriocheir]|uniref:SC24C n=1 Tax=Hepatospora eriocheir TaxID=1081669 RepID=A0A1X0QCL0_9MICR|nr:SC24C [Hepatospora eriocheir]